MEENREITFPQWNQTMRLPAGITVADACAQAGHPLNLVCGGKGLCGKCLVEVTDGEGTRTVRACAEKLTQGMAIATLTQGETLRILEEDGSVPLRFASEPNPKRRYAAACDLGTTSVVLYLYDRREGRKTGQWSALNGQSTMGADVVARLQAALEPQAQRQLMEKAVDTLNGLLTRAAADTGIAPEEVSELAIAGNSAMVHLLLGYPVEQLARAPFACYREDAVTVSAAELGLKMSPEAIVTCLPLIGSFVGGDTVAALLAADMDEKLKLLIDLGTNGELVLGDGKRRLAASAAAGPAMEGAGIVRGMRGSDGAIERVRIKDGSVSVSVIGGGKARGLCGSGLVDLLAELVAAKLVTPQGRMADSEGFLAAGGSSLLAARLVQAGDQRAFVVAGGDETERGEKILFYQEDIRAMQMSKGAIAAAAQLLLSVYGAEGTDLAEVQLAGAFGNYIDVDSAQRIGLIPDFPGVPVRPVGNAAGLGAQQYLLSEDKRREADVLAAETQHVELASLPDFTMTYAMSMELCPMSELDLDEF